MNQQQPPGQFQHPDMSQPPQYRPPGARVHVAQPGQQQQQPQRIRFTDMSFHQLLGEVHRLNRHYQQRAAAALQPIIPQPDMNQQNPQIGQALSPSAQQGQPQMQQLSGIPPPGQFQQAQPGHVQHPGPLPGQFPQPGLLQIQGVPPGMPQPGQFQNQVMHQHQQQLQGIPPQQFQQRQMQFPGLMIHQQQHPGQFFPPGMPQPGQPQPPGNMQPGQYQQRPWQVRPSGIPQQGQVRVNQQQPQTEPLQHIGMPPPGQVQQQPGPSQNQPSGQVQPTVFTGSPIQKIRRDRKHIRRIPENEEELPAKRTRDEESIRKEKEKKIEELIKLLETRDRECKFLYDRRSKLKSESRSLESMESNVRQQEVKIKKLSDYFEQRKRASAINVRPDGTRRCWMSCELCKQRFTTEDKNRVPRLFPCGHTFCTECIGKSFKDGSCKCPLHREKWNCNWTGESEHPINYLALAEPVTVAK